MLLSNGSLGCCPPQALHRDSKGPCPLPGVMKNRQVDMTKIKSLLQKRQTSLCLGHEWLAIVVLWFHWNVFILATATSLFEQRKVQEMVQIGLIKSPQVVICEEKSFFCSLNFFCEKFPIKHCSTHNMWIRWSFRSISSSYFHRNIMYIWIFAHSRLTTYQIEPECGISENSSRTFAGVALHSEKFTN